MRIRVTGLIVLFTFLSVVSASVIFAQQRRPRSTPAPAPAPQADLTLKYRSTTSGQTYETATMIKGKRERSEMRTGYMDNIGITQCDLKRTIQINEKTRKYLITPMGVGNSSTPSSNNSSMATTAEPSRPGGVVYYTTTTADTGERREMFGFTARHIKSSMTMESSPEACNPVKQRVETDGWYIDLSFGLDCDLGPTAQIPSRPMAQGGCQDRAVTKQLGAGRKGYPLIETTIMYGPAGNVMYSTTKEVLELSRAPLDAALFELPAGYSEVTSSEELYAAPSVASLMDQANQAEPGVDASGAGTTSSAMTKAPGTLRVGVVAINNRTDRPVSLDSLRQRLIGGIEGNGIDAIALNAVSPAEIEAEAQAKQCDFILYTDISTLKISAAKKLGGLLGRAAGVSGIEKTESRVDFKLFAVGETSPLLQSSAAAKEEGEEASTGASLDSEASKVSAEVRKKARS